MSGALFEREPCLSRPHDARLHVHAKERLEDRLAQHGGALEWLRLPAALFGVAVRARGWAYDRGVLPRERVDAPVVSVGNLSAGGTGKTPCVAWLVRELERRGRRPGIVSRGYGARAGQPNDEALELAQRLPHVPHAQDRERARAARAVLERGADVIVLDDGFQHRRLARDLDVVLVDATRPWGLPAPAAIGPHPTARPGAAEPVCALLPRGLLREPPAALARAHALIVTRADQVEAGALERLCAQIARRAPRAALARAVHRPVALRPVSTQARGAAAATELASLRGARVWLASGIGNPEAFERSVRALGAAVDGHARFPDHHAWSAADVDAVRSAARGARVLTTAKDAVKLRDVPAASEFAALEIELDLIDGAERVGALLDALPEAAAERERRALHGGLAG